MQCSDIAFLLTTVHPKDLNYQDANVTLTLTLTSNPHHSNHDDNGSNIDNFRSM